MHWRTSLLARSRWSPLLLLAAFGHMLVGCYVATAPQMSGMVKDRATGAPLSDVQVTVDWVGYRPAAFVDSVKWLIESQRTVTDADGRYAIQRKIFLVPVLRTFDSIQVCLYHPLYDSAGEIVTKEEFGKKPSLDFEMLHLADRYRLPEDYKDFLDTLGWEDLSNLSTLKNETGVRYDLDEILAVRMAIAQDLAPGEDSRPLARQKQDILDLQASGY